jgi:crotonobetainyl-CoA:carnitine CoA-transferase CaiB-like acyl-CoA transferase
LGAHTREVLTRLGGLDPAEIETLERDGVISCG